MTTMEWVCVILIFAQAAYIGILQNRLRLAKNAIDVIGKVAKEFVDSVKKGSNNE